MSRKANKSPQDKRLIVAGVMTGTSCDGMDVAAIEFDSESWVPMWEASRPYPKRLRERVFALQRPEARTTVDEVYALHSEIGAWLADSISDVLAGVGRREKPDVISIHGQTVAHRPKARPVGYTVQLGDPARIAAKTGITVVSNFRQGDVASGGEGAPLVPGFHHFLASILPDADAGVSIHNLGGISNFTYLDAKGTMLACDTGPANVWIDAAIEKLTRGKKRFDESGRTALRGTVHTPTLKKLLKHPFLKRPAPKSTGRDEFNPEWFFKIANGLKGEDLVATATAFTVESIAGVYERMVLDKRKPLSCIYLCGGGAKNETLRHWLQARLPKVDVRILEEYGFESEYVEAQSFALLGYRSLLGLPVGGNWTGVRGFAPPGSITPGKNWARILERLP